MKKENKEPEDLQVEIGSEDMALWKQVKERGENINRNLKKEIMVNEALIETANRKYKEAKFVWEVTK